MAWQEKCIKALSDQNLFKDSWHKTRFKELMDCYSNYPFFTRGLCKCMYLSAWDEEHFCIMLENLAEMTLGKEKNTNEMQNRGDILAHEQTDSQYYVYLLSCAFLKDSSFHLEEDAQIEAVLQLPLVSRILSLIKSAPLSPHMASALLCHDRYNWKLVLVLSSLLLPQTDHMLLYSR